MTSEAQNLRGRHKIGAGGEVKTTSKRAGNLEKITAFAVFLCARRASLSPLRALVIFRGSTHGWRRRLRSIAASRLMGGARMERPRMSARIPRG